MLDEEEWFLTEFDDKSDWTEFFSILCSQFKLFTVTITEKFPQLMAQFLVQKSFELINFNDFSVTKNFAKTLNNLFSAAFETYHKSENDMKQSAVGTCLIAIDALIAWSPADDLLLTEKYFLLSKFADLCKAHPDRMIAILTLLFKAVNQSAGQSGAIVVKAAEDAAEAIAVMISKNVEVLQDVNNARFMEELLQMVSQTRSFLSWSLFLSSFTAAFCPS